jgi:hypothetical protein
VDDNDFPVLDFFDRFGLDPFDLLELPEFFDKTSDPVDDDDDDFLLFPFPFEVSFSSRPKAASMLECSFL